MPLTNLNLYDGFVTLNNSANKEVPHWQQPIIFNLKNERDIKLLDSYIKSGQVKNIVDNVEKIANNLFEYNFPHLKNDDKARDKYVSNPSFIKNDFGVWVFFPWSGELVRYPDKDTYYYLRTFRFRNLISKEELDILKQKKIAVIGMSVGSNIAISLVRNFLCNEIFIADLVEPNIFNIGRANFEVLDICIPKVDTIAKQISYLDPFIKINTCYDGINNNNINKLNNFKPDILIDEIDDMKASILLRKYARENKAPYVTAADVHDICTLEVVRHDLYSNTPLYAKYIKDSELDNLSKDSADMLLSRSVGLHNLSYKLANSAMLIGKNLCGYPQLGSTTLAAAAFTTSTCRDILLGKTIKTGIYKLNIGIAKESNDLTRISKLASYFIKLKINKEI